MTKISEIKKYAAKIAAEFQPKKIILFGSFAYGNPTKDSDVDLMVLMPFKGRAVDQEVKIRLAIPRNFPLDLLAGTPEWFKGRVKSGDFLMREISEKGKVLYEAGR